MSEFEINKEVLKELQLDSPKCADCSGGETSWASANLGIFLCIVCAGIHRKLGTHVSRIKSIQLDSWKDAEVEVMRQIGNTKANQYWEASLPSNFIKPNHCDSVGYKEQWITIKYSNKAFVPLNELDVSIKRIKFDLQEGWIIKKGIIVKNWKRRWLKFVGEDTMHYYKDPTDKNPCGVISLKDAGQIDSVDQVDGKPFCFIISTPKRRYLISCPTGEEMFIWIHRCRLISANLKNSTKTDNNPTIG